MGRLHALERRAGSPISFGCGWCLRWRGARAALGIVISAGIQWVLLGRALKQDLHRWHIPSKVDTPWLERSRWSICLPADAHRGSHVTAFWLASAFLVRQPGGLEQIAVFGAANSFRLIVIFIPNVMNNVGMSSSTISGGRARKAPLGLLVESRITVAFVSIGAWRSLPAGPGCFARSARTSSGIPVLRVPHGGAILESAATWIYQVIQSHGKMWLTLFSVTIPRDLVILTLAYLLTPQFGATGLAAAYVGGWASR